MLTQDDINICEQFARAQLETSKDCYKSRGQSHSFIHQQITQGKLAEIFVARYLSSLGKFTTLPDFSIYGAAKKNYEADLKLEDKDVYLHVKSCSLESANKYGWSWIFQKNDSLVTKPQPNHFIVLCKVYSPTNIKIHSIINSFDIEYQPTRLNHPSKCAIYA